MRPISLGSVPLNLLESNANIVKESSIPRQVAIVPTRLFDSTLIRFNIVAEQRASGSTPIMLFIYKLRSIKVAIEPYEVGMDPEIFPFVLKSIDFNCVRAENSLGSDPTKLLFSVVEVEKERKNANGSKFQKRARRRTYRDRLQQRSRHW